MKRWALAALCVPAVLAQTGTQGEISQKDEPATFTTHVNLVMVPVVVRDKTGRAIGDLTKQNFLLLDKGKPQQISRFTVEKWSLNGPSTVVKPDENEGGSDRLPPANMP